MFLEVFSHERLVGEMQPVGYLLNAKCGIFQQHSHLHGHETVYPIVGRTLAYLFHRLTQVFGCDVHLVGIPIHSTFKFEMCLQQQDEIVENLFPEYDMRYLFAKKAA